MNRLGIFLGYAPGQLDPHQGISRLITFIVKGALKNPGMSVTIAGPGWLRRDIEHILEDASIPLTAVDIVTTRGEPFILKARRLYQKFRARRSSPRKREGRMLRIISRLVEIFVDWISETSTAKFLLGLFVVLILSAFALVPALVLTVVVAVAYLVKVGSGKIISGPLGRSSKKVASLFRRAIMSVAPQDRIRASELNRLVQYLNKRRDVGAWFVPSMFWPEVAGLQGKIIMAAPDIVFYDFPAQYNIAGGSRQITRITSSLPVADHLICYSDYVKRSHLIEKSGVPENKVSVIRHGFVDMSDSERALKSRSDALSILHSYIRSNPERYGDYLSAFDFTDVSFLFYSSQARPHKNLENLINAYEICLRQHYAPIKLILTANFSHSDRLRSLINSKGLQRDVLSIHSVPNDVLAALYMLASLQVTPTQFEGGFPFTFTEAYSTGTPSIMSRIPVVTEVIEDHALIDRMTFDPSDRSEMIDKILWGLDNRDKLYAEQAPLFEKFRARSWRIVADEYVAVMDGVRKANSG